MCLYWVLPDVVESAWEDKQPGAISRGFAYAVVERCCRAVYRDRSVRMYGATDREGFLGLEACDASCGESAFHV